MLSDSKRISDSTLKPVTQRFAPSQSKVCPDSSEGPADVLVDMLLLLPSVKRDLCWSVVTVKDLFDTFNLVRRLLVKGLTTKVNPVVRHVKSAEVSCENLHRH